VLVPFGVLNDRTDEAGVVGVVGEGHVGGQEVVHLGEVPALEAQPRDLREHFGLDGIFVPGQHPLVDASLNDQVAPVAPA